MYHNFFKKKTLSITEVYKLRFHGKVWQTMAMIQTGPVFSNLFDHILPYSKKCAIIYM